MAGRRLTRHPLFGKMYIITMQIIIMDTVIISTNHTPNYTFIILKIQRFRWGSRCYIIQWKYPSEKSDGFYHVAYKGGGFPSMHSDFQSIHSDKIQRKIRGKCCQDRYGRNFLSFAARNARDVTSERLKSPVSNPVGINTFGDIFMDKIEDWMKQYFMWLLWNGNMSRKYKVTSRMQNVQWMNIDVARCVLIGGKW